LPTNLQNALLISKDLYKFRFRGSKREIFFWGILSPRGTSGERVGGGARFCGCDVVWRPLSLTLPPLLRRGERESFACDGGGHFASSPLPDAAAAASASAAG